MHSQKALVKWGGVEVLQRYDPEESDRPVGSRNVY